MFHPPERKIERYSRTILYIAFCVRLSSLSSFFWTSLLKSQLGFFGAMFINGSYKISKLRIIIYRHHWKAGAQALYSIKSKPSFQLEEVLLQQGLQILVEQVVQPFPPEVAYHEEHSFGISCWDFCTKFKHPN